MSLIKAGPDNIDSEHICRAASKKSWMKERFKDGYVFLKADVRGRAFIEYIAAEKARVPAVAPALFTAYSLFHNGRFVTKEIFSEKKIEAFLKICGC